MSTASEEMSREEALAIVSDLSERDEALERSMAAVTWAIWGVVLAGMMLSYSVWEAVPFDLSHTVHTLLLFLFVPWVLVGTGLTHVLWRSVGIGAPTVDERLGRSIGWGVLAAVAAGVLAALATSSIRTAFGGLVVVESAGLLTAVGVATLALAAQGIGCRDDRQRRVLFVGGLLVVGLTLAVTVLAAPSHETTRRAFWVAAPAIPLAVYTVGGLLLARRG